ncbi:MAG: transglutaminase-like domain-containing protein [Vicingaceae bacterium]
MVNAEKVTALINLLDDPDLNVFSQVSEELQGIGPSVVPSLEEAWEKSFNAVLQERIEQVIHQIQFQNVVRDLKDWKKDPSSNLLDAAVIIAHYQYADLDRSFIYNFIDQLTQDIWIELNANYTALEKVGIMNKIFFEIYGFSGNKKNYYSPRNSYINNVLEARMGNPISLSLVYLEVAQRLKLPIYGINLAEHFVLAYTELPLEYLEEVNKESILFYINPFNKGTIFQYKEIEQFLSQLKLDVQEKFYLPCDQLTVVNRLLNNLIFCYNKAGYKDKVEEIKILKNCIL